MHKIFSSKIRFRDTVTYNKKSTIKKNSVILLIIKIKIIDIDSSLYNYLNLIRGKN